MFDLENISVSEFFQLKDDELAKKYLRFTDPEDTFYIQPSGTFRGYLGVKLSSLTYGQVAGIKQILDNPTEEIIFNAFSHIFGVKRGVYLNAKITEFMAALNYIKEEVISLVETENQLFESDPDPLMEEAGAQRLAMFGELNILKLIGMQFGKSPMEVENWSYNLVISLVVHNNTIIGIEKKYAELTSKKNGPKR